MPTAPVSSCMSRQQNASTILRWTPPTTHFAHHTSPDHTTHHQHYLYLTSRHNPTGPAKIGQMSAQAVTGCAIKKGENDPAIKPDTEYPTWLFELMNPEPSLAELERAYAAEGLTLEQVRAGRGLIGFNVGSGVDAAAADGNRGSSVCVCDAAYGADSACTLTRNCSSACVCLTDGLALLLFVVCCCCSTRLPPRPQMRRLYRYKNKLRISENNAQRAKS